MEQRPSGPYLFLPNKGDEADACIAVVFRDSHDGNSKTRLFHLDGQWATNFLIPPNYLEHRGRFLPLLAFVDPYIFQPADRWHYRTPLARDLKMRWEMLISLYYKHGSAPKLSRRNGEGSSGTPTALQPNPNNVLIHPEQLS